MVGKSFVPTKKYNDEKANTKAQTDALNALKTEFETFKQSKMSDEEKQEVMNLPNFDKDIFYEITGIKVD